MASDADLTPQMRFIADEARGMLYRLSHVKPFALHETMVPAAAVSVAAQSAIEHYLSRGRVELRRRILGFLQWLAGPAAAHASPDAAHRRLAFLRLRFNAVLSHFDVFSIVMTQRSEHQTGVWLSGLDVVARDALTLREEYYDVLSERSWLESKVSEGGTASVRLREQLAHARAELDGQPA